MKSIFIDYGLSQVFGTSQKVHYVMKMQKLFKKFIQSDYIMYNIVMLNPLSI
jgi:hypothetical protein